MHLFQAKPMRSLPQINQCCKGIKNKSKESKLVMKTPLFQVRERDKKNLESI